MSDRATPYGDQFRAAKARVAASLASTTARGYGSVHQRWRRYWAPLVAKGDVHCARGRRCLRFPNTLIAAGEPWDLGHDDHDRSRYSGPEHRACNRGEPSRRKARRRGSLEW